MSGPIYISQAGYLERERLDGTVKIERLVWSSYNSDEAWWEDSVSVEDLKEALDNIRESLR